MTKKMIFIHIPKTAGSTFSGILQDTFSPERCFNINAGSITSAKTYYEITGNILTNLDSEIINSVDLIHGHMPFIRMKKYDLFSPITFLREPVRRVVSDYLYIKSTYQNPLHYILSNMRLKDYVSKYKDLHLDNLQTRLVSGKVLGELSEVDLEFAKSNLFNEFAVYGITEEFNLSLVLMNHTLGWQILKYETRNVTRDQGSEITETDLKAVRDFNKMDILLYKSAKERFLTLIDQRKTFFDGELRKIIRANASDKASIFRKGIRRLRKLIK